LRHTLCLTARLTGTQFLHVNNTSIYSNQARLGSSLENSTEQSGKQNGPKYKKGILIVEDDSGVRKFLRTILVSDGYHVFDAGDEAEARKLWAQHFTQIDLLLTDLCIPYQTTGVQLAKKLRAEKSWLKVIYTSGFGPEIVTADELSQVKNVNFICKPYPAGKLLATVRNCFEEKVSLSTN
jgi:DNA-binding NtrC family response regulator